jgi:release factor glutamine methyltransferase
VTICDYLDASLKTLVSSGIDSAHLDTLLLLEDVMERDRSWLLAHPEAKLRLTQIDKLEKQLKRRAKHEPLAYIRGKSDFYGREFFVNRQVLVPRPETETFIELLLNLAGGSPAAVIDVGTGSGCLAVTSKLELSETEVFATDVDKKCLKIAHYNARKFQTDITFLQGDLLQPLLNISYSLPAILLANLPYVPDKYDINRAAGHEPKLALYGGSDGLEPYRRLFSQIALLEYAPAYVLTEALPFQHDDLAGIASTTDYQLLKSENLTQIFMYGHKRN